MSPVLGISACLVGRPVRYDGGHKRNDFVMETLAPHVRFVPVCPEVELGLGTPRETLRLIRRADEVRMIMANGTDYTDAMRHSSERRVSVVIDEDLDGYILKKDSPSCGFERVKVYDGRGGVTRKGRGLFADALVSRFPSLPVEDEGRLEDPRLRENFIERVFAYRRVKSLFAGRWTPGGLVEFHTAQKMTLLAHSTDAYRALGRLVADVRSFGRAEVRDRYTSAYMKALAALATPARHTNVLLHMVGHLRGKIDSTARDELLATIRDYRAGLVPLIVPIVLLKHHVRVLGVPYLAGQVYLDPHPKELMLRNHV